MKGSLVVGLSKTRRWSIDEGRTIGILGPESRVYATPYLIHDLETTCREFLLEHVESGEDSVGTKVDLDHLAPTPLGMWVDITVTVAKVNGRAVSFAFTAADALDTVASGQHGRFVADVEKTKARLAAKAQKAGL
ncbi:Thioesterase [Candidatus Terasakiella magnetica]|nr:Thioesterase [Candidatus Terasakiella magnetica]